MYANINNPANFQLQDFAQFGFRVITTDFIPVPGEQYRTLYVLQDAVVTATTQKGDDITSKAILAGTLLHGLFNSVSITSGRVLAYAAGRVTAEEIIALYEAYVVALGGTIENTQCAIDTLNDTGVDFFADASLVMIPDGYGTGVVYGQRPLTSDSQLTFTRASTATRVGPNGAIAVVGSNVPRIDYTGGGCGKLLLEPQRTNKITYSENQGPTGTNWYPSTTWTVTNNTVTSPSGYQDADTLTETTSNTFHSGYFNATIESSYTGTYTISAFAKYNGRIFVLNPYPTGVGRTYFDLQNGTVLQAGTGVTAKIENYGNGWYRCICTASFSSQSVSFEHMLASAVGTVVYTGNGTSGVHIWGCMAEAGAYATSYIPTLGSTVTRLADACYKTGISSLIGQTEGTIFLEMSPIASTTSYTERVLRITGGTDEVGIQRYGDNRIVVFGISGGVTSWSVDVANIFSAGQVEKIAVGYKLNDVAVYVNGVQIGTDTSAAMFTSLADLFFANDASGNLLCPQNVKQALLFKTRLTNEQLQTLTSL